MIMDQLKVLLLCTKTSTTIRAVSIIMFLEELSEAMPLKFLVGELRVVSAIGFAQTLGVKPGEKQVTSEFKWGPQVLITQCILAKLI